MEKRKERFFKVIRDSPLQKKYFIWKEHKKKMVELANKFLKENNIETSALIPLFDSFYLRKGQLNFSVKKQLDKNEAIINGIWFYKLKQKSKLMRKWRELLLENNIEKNIVKPSLEPYLKNIGKYEYRYFDQEGVIYYTQTNCSEWYDHDCLEEISEDEYMAIMTEYDKKFSNAKDDEEKVVR